MYRWTSAWDRPCVDFPALVDLVVGSKRARSLPYLLASLPRGLVHAQSVTLVSVPPRGFEPLTPGGAWFAAARNLAVTVSDPEAVLGELAELAWWWARVRSRLRPADGQDSAVRALWASDLELDAETIQWLDAHQGWSEVEDAARFTFAPVLRVDPALRPGHRRVSGEQVGETLAGRWGRPMPVLVAASSLALDALSPYVRDLGHALQAWGSEHLERFPELELRRALLSSRGRPDPAVGAIVAASLLEEAVELREERRTAERSQGLELFDASGLTAGTAQLDRLAAPHPRLENGRGALGLLFGQDGWALEGALEVLLEAQLLSGLALLGRVGRDPEDPVLPAALVGPDDGYALPSRDGLAARAEGWSIPAQRSDLVDLSWADHRASWIPRTLGKTRRSMVRGRARSDLAVLAAFVRSDPALSLESVASARAVLGATAVLVGELCGFTLNEREKSGSIGVSTVENRPSKRRFRV